MKIERVPWKKTIDSGFQVLRLADLLAKKKQLSHSPDEPQRLDFHVVMLFCSGMGVHMVDFEKHECRTGTLIHIGPDQVHSFHHGDDVEAWMLVFRSDVLSPDFYGPESDVSLISAEYVWPVAATLPQAEQHFGERLFELLASQQQEPGRWRRGDVARHLTLALADFSFRAAVDNSSASGKPLMPDELFLGFVAELKEAFIAQREGKWYSERLGCSYRTLCRVCESAAGKSPKQLIDERVVTEARRLLAYSRKPVYVVADKLGFSESTNFVKFFQRLTGETPEAFRNKWQADC